MIIDSDFQKFEQDNLDCSCFQELLLTKKKNFETSIMLIDHRKELFKQFRTIYKRTALAKLPQIIEMIDILLENRISCIVAVYHPLILEAIQAALENRKVPHVDLTNFFQADD